VSGNSSRSGYAFPWIGHTLIAAILVIAAGVGLARAAAPAMQLLLDIVINGNDTRQIGSFMQKGNLLLASRKDLQALGLILPPARPGDTGKTLIALNRLKNVSYRLDQATQTVNITATTGGIKAIQLNRSRNGAEDLAVQSSTGALMNYDVVAQSQFGQGAGPSESHGIVSSAFDTRVFNPFGVLDTSFLASNDMERHPFVRLDSSYSYSDPSNLRQYQLGDFISGSLAWTRAVRLGGMQIATNFTIDPDLITYPLPIISGQAAVPSSVDVLVDGVHQLSSQVSAGPFEVTQLPAVNGSGEVSVVVKNALGQQITETLPFYASEMMLAPGLSSYSIETGFVRRRFGELSDDYKTPAASASWRYGVTPWLTVEAHGEGTNTLAMGGAGVIVTLDNEVLVSLADAVSKNAGRTGMQYAVQIQHNDPVFNVDASLQEATPGFRDIAAVSGDPVPTMILQAGGGVSYGAIGSLGVNFTKVESRDEHDTVLTASYSRQLFRRAYLFVNAFRDFTRHGGGDGVLVSFSIAFGDRGSVSVDPNVSDGQYATTVQAVEATPDVGDVGGQLLATDGQGQQAHEYGELDYRSPFGQFGIGVDHQGATQTVRATADGSIALADGSLFATNTIYDSFAVVDTGGVKGIDVTDENRPYGKTGSSGELLIPDLQSFEANQIAIDPNDIPINDNVNALTQIVRPQDRSGVVVRFRIRPSDGAILQLVDAAGKSLPVGSAATLQGTTQQTIVGYQGEVFLQGLQPRNVVTVMRPDGSTCSSVFSFKAQSGSLPTIGPVVCHAGARK